MKRTCLTATVLILMASLLLVPVEATTLYWWDNICFVEGLNIKYPHPDRDYYSISPFSDWTAIGTKLYHNQINYDTSQISGITLVAVCIIAGAVIGTRAGPYGSVVGAVVGAVLGAIVAGYMVVLRDEVGCIWWWTSISFVDWIIANAWWLGPFLLNPLTAPIATVAIESAFLLYGYLRVGGGTIYDAVGAGSPSPPPSGGGGGGCPTLFVWNGTSYVEKGVLDIHAESDVTVQHQIQNILVLDNGVYKLQLRELDNYTSHIDQVKLYAVDSEGEWHSCPLTYAYHSSLGKVKQTLLLDDSNRVDLKPTETIDLKFAPSIPYSQTVHFIFEINGYNMKWPGE